MGTLKNPENHLPNLHFWVPAVKFSGVFFDFNLREKNVEIREAGHVPLESLKVDFGSTPPGPRIPGLGWEALGRLQMLARHPGGDEESALAQQALIASMSVGSLAS